MVMEESPYEAIEPQSVLKADDWPGGHEGQSHRWLWLLMGSGLLLGACRSRQGLPLALAGGVLLYRAVTDRWPLADWRDLDTSGARRERATSVPHGTGIKVERSVFVNAEPDEIYRFWRNLENLPRFMSQLISVQQLVVKRSRWTMGSLAGTRFEWDAEIINEIPDELLAWRSLEGADLDHAGSVLFEKAARGGAKVTVILEYRAPAGRIGAEIATLFGANPAQLIDKNLQRLKELMETNKVSAAAGEPQPSSFF